MNLADQQREILSPGFASERTQVENYVGTRGHLCFFLPKFHCEMNPIERVWGQSKRYCQAHTNFTLVKLREVLNPSLDSVSLDLIRKYFRKVRDYEKAYIP
jgi:transposase